MSKNHIKYEDYLKIKEKTVLRSYAVRYKKLRLMGLLFSYFGHFSSIFFAYFFFLNLFANTTLFAFAGSAMVVGIILFLIFFESIKRYTFDLFSLEYVKLKGKIFQKSILSFVITTFIIMALSFVFSLKGAKDLVNKENNIEITTEVNITSKVDSINNYYEINYIKPMKEENTQGMLQKSKLLEQQSNIVSRGWSTAKISSQISDIDKQLNSNKELIFNYEKQRDDKINILKKEIESKKDKEQSKNKTSVLYFILIAFIIDFVIILGVWYNRIYDGNVTEEFENERMKDPKFRKWIKYDTILDLIFHREFQIGDSLESTSSLTEIAKINELNISEREIEDCFKVLSHLKVYERVGNKRILKLDKENSKQILRDHFKVDI